MQTLPMDVPVDLLHLISGGQRGPLVATRLPDGSQALNYLHEMTPQQRQQWVERQRNFIRF